MRQCAGALAALALILAGAACGDDAQATGRAGKQVEQLPSDLLPAEVLGLRVTREDMSKPLASAARTYIDSAGLYGLRNDELLQATLQVNRFGADHRYQSAKFRRNIVAQIGTSKAKTIRVGDAIVFQTTGRSQKIAEWFNGRYHFVLAVRDDYPTPRTLLRKVLELTAKVPS